MGPQIVPFIPLNKIKPNLEHFSKAIVDFLPKAKFFAKFFGESKKIIFSPFMQNYIFNAYRHAVLVLRYPQSIILTFSTQRCNLSGSLFFKPSIFLLLSSEKVLYLLRNQNQIVKCYITYTY